MAHSQPKIARQECMISAHCFGYGAEATEYTAELVLGQAPASYAIEPAANERHMTIAGST